MRHPRISSSLFVVLGLLAMLAMPLTASAGSGPSKKTAAASKAASKKKVDPARSAAAKKGWETRRMNQKAESNWASRVAKNPKLDTPAAKKAFIKASVASQRGWQTRKATKASAAQPKAKAKKSKSGTGKKKVAAASSKKNSKKSKKAVASKKGNKPAAAADDGEAGAISASAGAADLKNALAKFEEAQFAQGEGRAEDAAIAQMEGHDLMAQAAFAAADEYEAAGDDAQAAKLNAFGEGHLAEGDKLEQSLQASAAADQAQVGGPAQADRPSRPGAVRRFFAKLNPANWGKNRNRQADNGQFQFE